MKLYLRYCCHAIITNHQMLLKVNCKYIVYVNNLICKQKSLKINHILSQSYICIFFFFLFYFKFISTVRIF